MRILIDNLNGAGPIDYSAAVTTTGPLTLQRKLNAPSSMSVDFLLEATGLPTPVRRGRVVVSNLAGAVLFTGYVPREPAILYAGESASGAIYRVRVEALSDEWVLNRAVNRGGTSGGPQFNVSGASAVAQLTQATNISNLQVANGSSARAVGAFSVTPGANWSTNAAAAANATYSAVRVVSGTVLVDDAGVNVHSFDESTGALNLQHLSSSYARELANDVTLTGGLEAAAYVQEIFQGDGTTSVFTLNGSPFRGTDGALLQDDFNQPAISQTVWTVADGGSHLQLTANGLTMSGGNGLDGETTLSAVNAVEMGGFVLAELGGVLFDNASDGMLSAFYDGNLVLTDCFAGFRVRQSTSTSGGSTVVVPVVKGVEVGNTFTPVSGHRYTLRLRLYCTEMQRVPQRYFCMVDGAVQSFGAMNGLPAPMSVVFEVLDEGEASSTPATVLYDSCASHTGINDSPALCRFVLVNSTNLYGSVTSVQLTRPGSTWAVSTLPNGSLQTRLLGSAAQGVDCELGETAGVSRLTFFSGRIPQPGECVTVFYRGHQRSVARMADAASVAAEAATGAGVQISGVSQWLGKVEAPIARSSADCEAAAQAVLAIGTSRSAALQGIYSLWNPAQDIWPGDVLELNSTEDALQVLVRGVTIQDQHSVPETLSYRCEFANDWATEWEDGLGLKLSEGAATDATLPYTAEAAPSALASPLQSLLVTEIDGQQLQIDAGMAPPPGGGLEVRRRDGPFGTSVDTPDLVLRSPVRSFSVPRSAQVERFYIRMYDGSTPPLYSRFSSAVFVNWPLQAN